MIHVGLTTSDDGVYFTRALDKPILSRQQASFDGGCTEDPRIVTIDSVFYMIRANRTYPPGQYWLREAKPVEDYGVSPHAPRALVELPRRPALQLWKTR